MNPARLVFIDETWAKTNMARLRGRSLRGHRLIAAIPQGTGKPAPSSLVSAATA
jgi:hypothetical protein